MAADPRILEKIKKCLALSASNVPAEAAAALARAQELMAKYDVAAEQLSGPAAPAAEQVVEQEVKSIISVTRTKSWELRLMRGVATTLGCELLFCSGFAAPGCKQVFAKYILLGVKGEVEVARYTAEVLLRQLVRARAAYTQTLHPAFCRAEKTHYIDSYCEGWSKAACERVRSLKDARTEAAQAAEAAGTAAPGTALLVLSAEEKKAALLAEELRKRAGGAAKGQNRHNRLSWEAFERGQADGAKVSVNAGLRAAAPGSPGLHS